MRTLALALAWSESERELTLEDEELVPLALTFGGAIDGAGTIAASAARFLARQIRDENTTRMSAPTPAIAPIMMSVMESPLLSETMGGTGGADGGVEVETGGRGESAGGPGGGGYGG